MANRVYTDSDRALVFAELTINEGNIKRSARNLGIPVSTVRYMKQLWEKEGLPDSVQEALPAVAADFISTAERIRDKLLVALERYVDEGKITAREIVPAVGMLTDKLRAARGLDVKQVQHTIELPQPEQVRELFAGVLQEVVSSAQSRAEEIMEAEWESADHKIEALLPGSD